MLIYYHDDFMAHEMGESHPESPMRVGNLLPDLMAKNYEWREPRIATKAELALCHTTQHIGYIFNSAPKNGLKILDSDTIMNQYSLNAALRAVGAGLDAVDNIGKFPKIFCLSRPPGHHAESNRAMGFCFFSNIAICAKYALTKGFKRVAICDFDVHHGNGTQDCLYHEPNILFISSHQMPLYPGTGYANEVGEFGQIMNIPLPSGCSSALFWQKWQIGIEKLQDYNADLILISGGFDAHKDDPLANINLTDQDYRKFAQILAKLNTPIITMLEGGYHLEALRKSVLAYCDGLNL